MSEIAADRNLLFGILALQMDFVTRDALIAAMNAWVLDKQQPLGAMLVAQGVLRPERRALLEPLVDEHIRQHSDDPAQSLAAVGAGTSTREALRSIADGDLRFSLGHLGTASSDPESTATYVGSPTSSGGRFRILRFEAAGGLGEVYVARDEELQREVALKQIKNEHSHNQDLRSRFVVEAEITGGLEHPGIVPVYGLGHYDDGRPYYAMRFIKGESLKEAIKRFHQAEQPSRDPAARSLGLRQLLRRFLDVCNAIQYAHDRGVLHRDLKPGNVMLGPYGETLVVDWGLAKVVGRSDPTLPEETLQPASGSDVAATEAGVAIGTLVYMSPEQARGDLDRLGPASDVYSLGATLYHLLTGKAPFRGTDRAVLQAQVIAGEFPPPRQVHPAVPAGMDAICRKAMAREPKDRYARPRALADDIEHWVADEPVTALPESWSQRAARWTRRHRAWAQAGAAALVLVTFVSIAATFAVNRARGLAEQRRKDADEQRKDADEQRYRAELQLARSDLDRGLNFCEQGDAARGLLWLARGLNDAPADAADLRHCMRMNLESWSRECHTPLICLEHGIGCTAVAFSPDGKTILTGSGDRAARLWDVATGKPIGSSLTHQSPVFAVAFSPDGKTIATGGGFEVRLWDANTGTSIGPPLTHQGFVSSVAFSPDGKTIATGSYDNTARLWDAATGKPMGTPMTHQGFVDSVAFSPDGKTIATESLMRARLWNVTAGKYFGTALTYRGDVTAVAFSPDGKTIATESNDHTFRLWDAATGKPIGSPMTHQGEVTGVAFSPDSKTIATRSLEGTARLWDAATGKPLGSPMTNQGGVTAVAFSSDGKTIATASLDRTARLWDAATGKPMGTPVTCQVWAFARAFSPDGKTIATVIGNTARLWDARTGKPLASPMAHQSMVLDVAFSPDGRTIATGSQDSVRLWDAATGKPIGPPLTHQDIVHAVAFSPDGKTIATGSRDRTARLWNVPSPMEGDADRITVWLRFLTNMELDSSDAINALDVHAWDQSRQELARRGGPPRQVNHGPEPDVAWHRREATESEASGQWFTARWHLDRLIAANPQDGSLYARRCSALAQLGLLAQAEKDYARAIDHGADAQDPQIQTFLAEICIRLGHLAEAADDYARLIELEPEPSSNWVKATYAQLLAGRVDRYRELSRAMLQRFEESPLGADAERTAKACLTVPDRPDLVARAAALAMRSLRHKPNDAGTVYCAALADYHVGRYELALYRLRLGRAALKSTPFGDWPGHPVMSYAVEAMASARLGHGAEARAALKQAETTLTTGLAAVRGTEGYLDFWHDWVHCEFLVREAQAVVADLGFPADPFAH